MAERLEESRLLVLIGKSRILAKPANRRGSTSVSRRLNALCAVDPVDGIVPTRLIAWHANNGRDQPQEIRD